MVCGELVERMLQDGRFPNTETLKGMKGIAFLDCEGDGRTKTSEGKSSSYSRYPLWTSSDFDVEKAKLTEESA